MTYIDISVPLSPQTIVYQGDPAFEIRHIENEKAEHPDYYRLSVFSMSTHTGTHIDPPLHVNADGLAIDELSPDVLCGPAVVIDLTGQGTRLDESLLSRFAKKFVNAERLLLKTVSGAQQESGEIYRDYAHLTGDGARFLRRMSSLRLVGIDTLSVDGWPDPWPGFGFPAHHALLDGDHPTVILENIDLRAVAEGWYDLLCLPLRILRGDGGPARALLRPR